MPSEQIKLGVGRAPNRSLLYALGLTEEELSRPLVGIVSSYNEIVPGHMRLPAAPRSCSRPLPSATASPWATWA